MIELTLENVQKYLEKKEYPFQLQEETNQLYAILRLEELEFPTFIRSYPHGNLLQILLFIPCSIKDGCEGDLARLLHQINKEIDIPGFGMEEQIKVPFYRIMLPSYEGKMEEGLLDIFLSSFENLCKTYVPTITAVAQGKTTFKTILKQHKSSPQ